MKIKVILIVIGGLIVLMISAVAIVTHIAEQQIQEIMQASVEQIDLDALEDGIYTGEVKTIPIHVIVNVTISNHQITSIVIVKHRSGEGEKANAIIDDIIANQTHDVDVITGATYSSKVIITAIEKALIGQTAG